MHISSFTIKNYKSFHQAQRIQLTKGINIVTGQNNAGKTALLEALSARFGNNPHKSTTTLPSVSDFGALSYSSEVVIEFNLSNEEFLSYLSESPSVQLPSIVDTHIAEMSYKVMVDSYLEKPISITGKFIGGVVSSSFLKVVGQTQPVMKDIFLNDRANSRLTFSTRMNASDDISGDILKKLVERIYCFKAERLKISSSSTGVNRTLNPDASNLPEVLNILQGEPARFERYNSYVRRIFPDISLITTRPVSQMVSEIVVWNENHKLERSDLVVPLSECGTGLSQALAILYVVLTSDFSKVIIIDEPNSFLHPGAARKLIEILKEHSRHQFIISTHSPTTLAASSPKTIHIVKIREAKSLIESIDVDEEKNQQLYLSEIGVKLSDIFGADDILWVEGKTEEICFSKIIDAMANVSLKGTVVLSVINTGDFYRKKEVTSIFEIYSKLSRGKGLLPPAIGFIFDSENLKDSEKEDLKRQSGNKVVFIPRKMFENYLINPQAVFHLFSQLPEINQLGISSDDISGWIDGNKWNKKYIKTKYSETRDEMEWLLHVDGAKLLSDLFSQVTNTKLSFDKIKHCVPMCSWIIENSFEDLKEIQDILTNFLRK